MNSLPSILVVLATVCASSFAQVTVSGGPEVIDITKLETDGLSAACTSKLREVNKGCREKYGKDYINKLPEAFTKPSEFEKYQCCDVAWPTRTCVEEDKNTECEKEHDKIKKNIEETVKAIEGKECKNRHTDQCGSSAMTATWSFSVLMMMFFVSIVLLK